MKRRMLTANAFNSLSMTNHILELDREWKDISVISPAAGFASLHNHSD